MKEKFDILVVEDSPTQALQLQFLLEAEGYAVTLARNGQEGLALLGKQPFSIVITDWVMPEMDGVELCRAIRETMDSDYIYLFLVTARSSKEEIVRGLEGGADDYLVKPIEPAELVARLATARRVLALEQALKERNREISRLLHTDHLTKVFNRNHLDEQLSAACKQAQRYGRALTVVICDIDHFKKVNDNYGHLIGDEVLKEIAQTLKETIRFGVDWVARYGGEEFVVVLPETDSDGAFPVCERMRRTVAALRFKDGSGGDFSVTASFGLAVLPATVVAVPVSGYDLIGMADACLYRAKNEGRNRVIGTSYE
ncbi:MAG: diguanylate cyclase [Deltaproteobacteria bacterium]|nr:diguanylate cyclase [Deltaproteobacteria bacterium]